jgi:hypothetical protein
MKAGRDGMQEKINEQRNHMRNKVYKKAKYERKNVTYVSIHAGNKLSSIIYVYSSAEIYRTYFILYS